MNSHRKLTFTITSEMVTKYLKSETPKGVREKTLFDYLDFKIENLKKNIFGNDMSWLISHSGRRITLCKACSRQVSYILKCFCFLFIKQSAILCRNKYILQYPGLKHSDVH